MLHRILLILTLLIAPASAQANAFERSIVSQLRAQGYSSIEVGRTLLGRGRITAQNADLNREIIFNPATGVILRDFARQRDRVQLFDPGAASQGGGSGFVGSNDDGDEGDSDSEGESDGDGDADGDGEGADGDGDGGDD